MILKTPGGRRTPPAANAPKAETSLPSRRWPTFLVIVSLCTLAATSAYMYHDRLPTGWKPWKTGDPKGPSNPKAERDTGAKPSLTRLEALGKAQDDFETDLTAFENDLAEALPAATAERLRQQRQLFGDEQFLRQLPTWHAHETGQSLSATHRQTLSKLQSRWTELTQHLTQAAP